MSRCNFENFIVNRNPIVNVLNYKWYSIHFFFLEFSYFKHCSVAKLCFLYCNFAVSDKFLCISSAFCCLHLWKNGHVTQNANRGCVFSTIVMQFPLISMGSCVFGVVFKTTPQMQHSRLFKTHHTHSAVV